MKRKGWPALCALLFGCAIGFVVVIQTIYPPMDVCRPEYESPRTVLGFAVAASSLAVYLGGAAWLRRRASLPTGVVEAGAVLLVLWAAYVLLPSGNC